MKREKYFILMRKLKQLEQDVTDMKDSHMTGFTRCNNCHRLHDSDLVCPNCGWDNSTNAISYAWKEVIRPKKIYYDSPHEHTDGKDLDMGDQY